MHGGSSLGSKTVEANSISDTVQCARKSECTRDLMVMDRATRVARLSGGAGDVKQDEHSEVPPSPLALDIDGVIGGRAGADVDVGIDDSVEVEILTLQSATVSFKFRSKAGQCASQGP